MTHFSKPILSWMLLVLLVAGSAWAQNAPTVQWQTVVNELVVPKPATFAQILLADNGEYQTLIGNTGGGSMLVRLTSNGTFKVARALPNSPDLYQVNRMIATQDGGYLLSGAAKRMGSNERIFTTKLDAQTNTVWNSIDAPSGFVSNPATFYGNTFLVETANRYVRFTNYRFRLSRGATREVFSKNGTQVSYPFTILDNVLRAAQDASVEDALEAVDGGILVVARFGSSDGLWKITDADTSMILKPIGNQAFTIKSVVPTASRDGYYAIHVALNGGTAYLSKLSPNGSAIWTVIVPNLYVTDAIKLIADPNGVVVGGTNAGRMELQKYTLTGNSLWQAEVDGGPLNSLIKTPDGGYAVSTSAPLFIKFSPEQPVSPTNFSWGAPAYDCSTGQLTIYATGNGSPIEYRIVGLRDWSTSRDFTVPSYQRIGTTFILEARLNGEVIRMAFTTACGTTAPPIVTPPVNPPGNSFDVRVAGYDCNTGQLSAVVNNPNGPVEYCIIGLRDWSGSNTFSVPSYQRTNTTFKVEARTSLGAYTTIDFTTACSTSPTTPPTGTALGFDTPAFNCETGLLRLITSGGDATVIEYRVPGLRDWANTTDFTVPTYQRTGTSFTLYARQSGREIITQYTTSCPVTARVASPETRAGWQVSVLGNPVENQVQVRLSGLAGQTVGLSLSDATGRVLSERQVSVQAEGQTETISMRGSAGVYLLRAVSNGQQQTLKVMKK